MIGFFGGSFDPVHLGHLQVAQDVADALDLSQVRFTPLSLAVHRDQPLASKQQRAEMLALAIKADPRFILDTRELDRQGKSYTLTSIQELRQEWPGTPICLLIGADAFNGFVDWHQPNQIIELCHIIVMQRPGHSPAYGQTLKQLISHHLSNDKSELSQSLAGRIWFQPVTQMDISSTKIRRCISQQESIRQMVPDAVADYIEQWRIYSDSGSEQSPT